MAKKSSTFQIPERFLRQLWKSRQFETSSLYTADGKPVELISTGTQNTDGGPDFNDAKIRIGGIVYRGDVELHKDLKEWKDHAHHLDPKYNSVILHVVLRGNPLDLPQTTKSKRVIPVLILEKYLAAPYHSLWEKMILGERAERLDSIKCFSVNERVESPLMKSWLSKLAVERIELKVLRHEDGLKELVNDRRLSVQEPVSQYIEIPFGVNPEDLPPPGPTFTARDFARRTLWQQLLYEGIMEALGYSKNQAPFQKLAKNLSLFVIGECLADGSHENEIHELEAMLFGAAGLIPQKIKLADPDSSEYAARLRKTWGKFQQRYRGAILNEAEWQFFRLRPENFPTVRIAGAARIIRKILHENLFKTVIQTVKETELSGKEKLAKLESYLMVPAEGIWSTRYTFEGKANATIGNFIGKKRAEEIIVNVIAPICFLYARIFKDKEVRQGMLDVLGNCPPLSDNTVTRTIDEQLLKSKLQLNSAMLQQGALQLYKFYCIEERCADCAVGKVVFEGKA